MHGYKATTAAFGESGESGVDSFFLFSCGVSQEDRINSGKWERNLAMGGLSSLNSLVMCPSHASPIWQIRPTYYTHPYDY